MAAATSTKRGMLRPNHGPSRAPVFVVVGLSVVCLILFYNYYFVNNERSALKDANEVLTMKLKNHELELKEMNSKNEALQNSVKDAEAKRREEEGKLQNAKEAEDADRQKLEKLETDFKTSSLSLDVCKQNLSTAFEEVSTLKQNGQELNRQMELLNSKLAQSVSKTTPRSQQWMAQPSPRLRDNPPSPASPNDSTPTPPGNVQSGIQQNLRRGSGLTPQASPPSERKAEEEDKEQKLTGEKEAQEGDREQKRPAKPEMEQPSVLPQKKRLSSDGEQQEAARPGDAN